MVATSALSFMLEPLFPLGDWRWGLVVLAGLVGLWWAHKRMSRSTPDTAADDMRTRFALQNAKIEARKEFWKQHGDVILMLLFFTIPMVLFAIGMITKMVLEKL